ncbi:hypothetical protein JB92DRAFT_3122294 [Gautieria morchelliformis]|nr:hypothetical protein JB92DRAFT_3122294 [Gautieria morchelliformis]
MAPALVDTSTGRRRSSRIADKRDSHVEEKQYPNHEKKTGNHSQKKLVYSSEYYNIRYAYRYKRFASQAKGSGNDSEDGEEQDELPDDGKDKVLSIGDLLPTVTLRNEIDEDVDVAKLAAEKGLILPFLASETRYASVDLATLGCRFFGRLQQAWGLRDSYPDFIKHDFNVYCVSADTTALQAKWQTKKELPYALLSDRQ